MLKVYYEDAYNLSILDFKLPKSAVLAVLQSSYNLSILDFKSATT